MRIYDEIGKPRINPDGPFHSFDFFYCPDDDSVYARTASSWDKQICSETTLAEAKANYPWCRLEDTDRTEVTMSEDQDTDDWDEPIFMTHEERMERHRRHNSWLAGVMLTLEERAKLTGAEPLQPNKLPEPKR